MLAILRQYWWKLLSVPILLFSIAAGLMIPLGPGVADLSLNKVETGTRYIFSITGYNTHFKQEENSTQAWLKRGDVFICSNRIEVLSDRKITASFDIPHFEEKEGSSNYLDLVLNNDFDGTFALREALAISYREIDASLKRGPIESCQHRVITDQAAFFNFPNREIIKESIRNLYFHVPMWFAMIFMLVFSVITGILYLANGRPHLDVYSSQAIHIALLFGLLGLLTGMLWARFTWGHPWPNDPRLNGTAVAMLVYLAYLVLRGSLTDEVKRARISAVYNIFAFVIYIVFIFVIPNMGDTLHPGRGENPAFSKYDLDNSMRLVFYPAVIGWTLLGFWIISLKIRYTFVAEKWKLSEHSK